MGHWNGCGLYFPKITLCQIQWFFFFFNKLNLFFSDIIALILNQFSSSYSQVRLSKGFYGS